MAAPKQKCQIVGSRTRQQVGQETKSKCIRIVDLPNDSIHFSPVDQCRKKPANKPRKFPTNSVTPQTCGTKVKTSLGVIPLLKPMKTLEHSICSQKESKKPAQGASEDIIESYSEAEGKDAPIQSESINSIPDDYSQFKADLEAEPTLYHDSEEEDKILTSSQSSDHNLEMKITKVPSGREFNHLASGSFSEAQNKESGKNQKSQTIFRKKFNEVQTEALEGSNPKTALKFKVSPTKHWLEGDSFSPKTHASSQSPTFDSDIRAKPCKNFTNSKEPKGKKRQISESLKMSDMRPQFAVQKDEISSSSKMKKLTKPSIPSVFAGLKKTVKTRSSARLTARKISNPFEDGQRPLTIAEASGSKGLGGAADRGVAPSPHLSRIQLGPSESSKEFLRNPDDPIQAKHLRFEFPWNDLARPNASQSRTDKSGLLKRDSQPLAEEAQTRDSKQRKFQSHILNTKNNLFKSAAPKTSTQSRFNPKGLIDVNYLSELPLHYSYFEVSKMHFTL
ncbi:uncharacterized protein PGTG_22104 [Puccinia graminis f. sp. tritici CRL 75-36-700-3]|uniref:Uncharacterized protein n=1 Tax=Puccinia graminis f. sp. tritici (strain CRL 75-36-700-3 / race SCCL) TaxID=418459 RepID=H6QTA4_PUCGT|nr:uncharacterized protein PGTG_22104 [Puccinia graminis f. sp. tritici CRL 75-36-700-3]EHS64049.1 hypothetical protein PGTG_22104 [Puccinia graminis f. sp. tritici CRL 75-36-700-3]